MAIGCLIDAATDSFSMILQKPTDTSIIIRDENEGGMLTYLHVCTSESTRCLH